MPSKRRFLRAAGLGGVASLAGCTSLLSDERPTTESGDCDQTTDVDDAEYDFSRNGQLRAKPKPEPDDEWATVSMSECLHREVQTVVRNAHERDGVAVRELSASERAAVRRTLHSQFDVTRPRFYVDYRSATIEVTVLQED